ncbi:MAG: O-methyltransferase [Clostridiales bacterium]|nr:O-methyltransferase [Clostridiales bacterium]
MKKEELIGFETYQYTPFIRQKSEEVLVDLLKKHNPKSVLEIGTFIGYSATLILENAPECKLISIEKEKKNFDNACKNLKKYEDRVILKNKDALEFLQEDDNQYDFIFLDGAKGQYFKYLPYLKRNLTVGGVLVADDVLFYGMVESTEKIPHKHRALVNNLRKFLQALDEDKEFDTQVLSIEDGLSISIKLK